jgi:inosine-uridine nucleoside N-ribohydrolase
MKQSIIHDCDPGNDDALGIFVAAGHPALDLLAVTTGAGHLESNRTARNAAIAVAAAGLSVPVAAGATRPLVRERLVAGILDFELGLDRERPDLSSVALDPRHSADLIAEIALAHPGLVIACSGPMTNLALALRRHPGIGVNIGRIVALGGAWGLGNKTAAAEWNILSDPEAASIVYGAGIPVVTVPIDAAACVGVDDDLVSAVGALEGAACELAVELLSSLRRTHRQGPFTPADAPLNDALALLIAADPSLARTLPARVDVETAGKFTYGRTVIDFAGKAGLPPNCEVVVEIDTTRSRSIFVAAMTALSGRRSLTNALDPRRETI